MTSVYLARDLEHHREVAIKVLRPELAVGVGVDRFVREIRLVARLTHPQIFPLFDSERFTQTPPAVTTVGPSVTQAVDRTVAKLLATSKHDNARGVLRD